MPRVAKISGNNMKISQKKLRIYLQNVEWNKKVFEDNQLEAMMAAGCLRFLAGMEELPFVLGLSKEISGRYASTKMLSMRRGTEILNDLYEKIQQKEIQSDDIKKIMGIIGEAQEAITGRRYYS